MQNLKITFEDDHLLILDKPAGLVVDKSETQNQDTLEDWLKSHGNASLDRGGIVHRLDKDTSGVILVAKTQKALENLQMQFKERKIKKEYLALVHGLVEKGGVVEGSIGRNPRNREKFTVLLQEGKEAVTEYEPLERLQLTENRIQEIFSDLTKPALRRLITNHYSLFTFLVVRPKTGRTHQIRVHLKYAGHPIISDEKYGGRKMYRLDKRWCPRMFLHARKLGFYHPVSGKWVEIESELPEDLEKALERVKN